MSTQGEPDEQNERGEDDALARAKRRGKTYALAIFVSFAAAFIVLSTWEIVAGVFAYDAPGGLAAHGKLSAACAVPLRAYTTSLDQPDAAITAANAASTPSLVALDAVCSEQSADLDALAAVQRFVRAAEAVAHSGRAKQEREEAIAPLRHDIEGYLAP